MATGGNRRATVVRRTAFGVVTLRPDPAREQGWELIVDGVSQSYVDLADPGFLEFEYMRRLGSVVRLSAAAGVPIKVLHLGGGALTLARWISATRPGSFQRVVERDRELAVLVVEMLPPASPVEIVIGDARAVLEDQDPDEYDVIVADVFDGARMPAGVASVGFARAAHRALRPDGVLAMNLTDLPPLAYSRVQVATLAEVFGDVALIAGGGMFRGRRAGNVILVATSGNDHLPVRALALDAARDPVPGRVVSGADLREFVAGARARLDEPA